MRISDWSSDVCSSDLELIEVGLLQRRNLDRHDIAAEVFGDQLVLQQFLLHAIRIGAGLIDFVDGDDDRHLSGLGVIDRLDRLLLDAVVGGHHSTTMSVTVAPRRRISVKAAWPGVSMKVMRSPLRSEEHTSEIQSLMR